MSEPEYITPTTQHLAICNQCGCTIVREPTAMIPHTEFHEQLDELIEWAQSVSKLFRTPEPPQKEWEPGDPIE